MKISMLVLAAALLSSGAIEEAVQKDGVSQEDLRSWYSVYKGVYIYTRDYKAVGSNNFEDIFVAMRTLRDRANPQKGNSNFVEASNLDKFKEMEFSPENLTDFSDEVYQIAEGLKKAIENGS